MKKVRVAALSLLFISLLFQCGCGNKFLDPTQIGRFESTPSVNLILDSLGVAQETPDTYADADEPRPVDVMVYETDYVFGPGDIVLISIFELQQEGEYVSQQYVVTETGKISIPDVGIVNAIGLTESQLEEEIKQILSPTILKDPSVTATLVNSQKRTYSVMGDGIPSPGRYNIPRYDFRLKEALAVAGSYSQFNISYIYVTRVVDRKESMNDLAGGSGLNSQVFDEPLEIIKPSSKINEDSDILISAADIADPDLSNAAKPSGFEVSEYIEPVAEPIGFETRDLSGGFKWVFQGDRWVQVPLKDDFKPVFVEPQPKVYDIEVVEQPFDVSQNEQIEWEFREKDGKWVPVKPKIQPVWPSETKVTRKALPYVREIDSRPIDLDGMGAGEYMTRTIRIPADKLSGGDPRYNIVIRARDVIHVPVDMIGEFYIYGNVNAPGGINITGRPITLKMAIALAGGLGPLAWPKRCEVIRRIGTDQEEIVMVDLDKIASGQQPDFFIKPNDLINVGTHPTSRWRSVLRNAFRATYGFGFIYDRNFADRDFNTSRPIPNWF
jgi:polysaccharide export outer membrane protein